MFDIRNISMNITKLKSKKFIFPSRRNDKYRYSTKDGWRRGVVRRKTQLNAEIKEYLDDRHLLGNVIRYHFGRIMKKTFQYSNG